MQNSHPDAEVVKITIFLKLDIKSTCQQRLGGIRLKLKSNSKLSNILTKFRQVLTLFDAL